MPRRLQIPRRHAAVLYGYGTGFLLLVSNQLQRVLPTLMKSKYPFLRRNSLSITLLALFFTFLGAQAYTGWKEHNNDLQEKGAPPIGFPAYLTSGHFIETTFENWESEFLQMGAYVLLTVGLRQQGSSESKPMEGEEEVDREPDPNRKDAPWPVKRGGFILTLYKSSLSIAFIFLFLASFALHAYGSLKDHNAEQLLDNKPTVTFREYIGETKFWFESFQNWQSEFIAVASIVILSIYLRQKGSPESKPVDAACEETGG